MGDERQLSGADLPVRVAELLTEPGYRSLLAQVRARLEAYGQPARITLQGLDTQERGALADLLGRRRRPGATTTVPIDELDRSLRASRVGAGLVEVLEAVGGPLEDRRDGTRRRGEAWTLVYDGLAERAAGRAELEAWLAAVRSDGLLARLGGEPDAARELGDLALDVLDRLPADAVPLSVLAAEVTGDPHRLDAGTPLATLVLRGAAELVGRAGLPTGARERRRLWSEVGVVCDPLSSSVLVLGLRASGIDLVAGLLCDHAGFGEPVRLTLRQLMNAAELPYERTTVSICENPAVMVAAADAFPNGCTPLVCTEGVPDAAADRLLGDLRAAGCELRFHTDFDGGGLRIGNLLHERFGASPWRMSSADYERALQRATVTTGLRSLATEARWDADLAATMREHGRVISEEQVLDDLLADLADLADLTDPGAA
ncbi:MAG TPA: TIGR02679 family protein [Nitriliruptorales bacterium]